MEQLVIDCSCLLTGHAERSEPKVGVAKHLYRSMQFNQTVYYRDKDAWLRSA
jgi:hypothetical protein